MHTFTCIHTCLPPSLALARGIACGWNCISSPVCVHVPEACQLMLAPLSWQNLQFRSCSYGLLPEQELADMSVGRPVGLSELRYTMCPYCFVYVHCCLSVCLIAYLLSSHLPKNGFRNLPVYPSKPERHCPATCRMQEVADQAKDA